MTRLRRYSALPTTSSEADRLRITVAPASARATEGGVEAHRSSHSSTPTVRPGMESQGNTTSAPRYTSCPQKENSRSPAPPGSNQRRS